MGWRTELERYDERIGQIAFNEDDVAGLAGRLPPVPLEYELGFKGIMALNLSFFVVSSCYAMANHSLRAFKLLWEASALPCVSLTVRLLFELWGALHFSRETLHSLAQPERAQKASVSIMRLTLGTRSPVPLPWGGVSDEKSFNVMEFVRSLSNIYPAAEDSYAFLCESCHPSTLQHVYWLMTVPPRANWNNETFARTAHELVEKTISICEEAARGIELDTKQILTSALEIIKTEQADGRSDR